MTAGGYTRARLFQIFFMLTHPCQRRSSAVGGKSMDHYATRVADKIGQPVKPNTVSANERVSLKTVVFSMAFSGSGDMERSGAMCRMRSAPTRLATPEGAGGEI
jgi:hypothetical protein